MKKVQQREKLFFLIQFKTIDVLKKIREGKKYITENRVLHYSSIFTFLFVIFFVVNLLITFCKVICYYFSIVVFFFMIPSIIKTTEQVTATTITNICYMY